MLIFQFVDFRCEAVCCLAIFESDLRLEDSSSAIVTFIDVMYCDARELFLSGNHSFMNMLAIESFSAIFWQQSWVNVDDLVWKRIDEMFWKKP